MDAVWFPIAPVQCQRMISHQMRVASTHCPASPCRPRQPPTPLPLGDKTAQCSRHCPLTDNYSWRFPNIDCKNLFFLNLLVRSFSFSVTHTHMCTAKQVCLARVLARSFCLRLISSTVRGTKLIIRRRSRVRERERVWGLRLKIYLCKMALSFISPARTHHTLISK